jgi:hypothetical protein
MIATAKNTHFDLCTNVQPSVSGLQWSSGGACKSLSYRDRTTAPAPAGTAPGQRGLVLRASHLLNQHKLWLTAALKSFRPRSAGSTRPGRHAPPAKGADTADLAITKRWVISSDTGIQPQRVLADHISDEVKFQQSKCRTVIYSEARLIAPAGECRKNVVAVGVFSVVQFQAAMRASHRAESSDGRSFAEAPVVNGQH